MKLFVRDLLSVLSLCMYLFAFLSFAETEQCADQLSEQSSYKTLFHGDHSMWPEGEQCGVPITRIRSETGRDTSTPDSMRYASDLDRGNHSKNRNDKNSVHRKLKGTKKQRKKKEKRKKMKKKQNKFKKDKLNG